METIMKAKSTLELRPNEELWQRDPFREPRAWALAWDVTDLMRTNAAPTQFNSAPSADWGYLVEWAPKSQGAYADSC
jgi:hypothetical protein